MEEMCSETPPEIFGFLCFVESFHWKQSDSSLLSILCISFRKEMGKKCELSRGGYNTSYGAATLAMRWLQYLDLWEQVEAQGFATVRDEAVSTKPLALSRYFTSGKLW